MRYTAQKLIATVAAGSLIKVEAVAGFMAGCGGGLRVRACVHARRVEGRGGYFLVAKSVTNRL
jgi:hypothetical protein